MCIRDSSSGLWYIPGLFSDSAEVRELGSLLRGTGKPYCTHMRSEGDQLLESLEEAIAIARCGSGSLQVSHFKTLSLIHISEPTRPY